MKTTNDMNLDDMETDITESLEALYYPKSALVFYETEGQISDSYIEFFDMDSNGNPINAHPLSVREAQRLAKLLSVQNSKEKDFLKPKGVISENILYLDSSENSKVIWFTKPQERSLFFVENLNIPNDVALIPPLLWVANKQQLQIFALESDNRPNNDTFLFNAPFFNVNVNGSVCMGNVDVKIKNSTSLEEFITSWEHYFFNSYFSHLNHNPIKGNLVSLWKKLMKEKKEFPMEVLVKTNLTLKNLL